MNTYQKFEVGIMIAVVVIGSAFGIALLRIESAQLYEANLTRLQNAELDNHLSWHLDDDAPWRDNRFTWINGVLDFLGAEIERLDTRIQRCPEDSVLLGQGQYQDGQWSSYVCGPAIDDYDTSLSLLPPWFHELQERYRELRFQQNLELLETYD